MSRRSFAGYACEESLSVGLFGECFRAKNKSGNEARVVVVDNRLAQRRRFASALARHGTKLSELVHPHVVTTQTVGRGNDGSLVVIASPVAAPLELDALIERAHKADEKGIPADIALSIAMGALRGLSHAHDHEVIHGGVHPRSVIVDGKGVTKLSDFGLAHALASAAAAAEDSELLRGLRGYVAPEIALGQEPDISSDVFAAGALVSQLLFDQPSPPDSEVGPLVAALRKAVHTDSEKRFSSASELEGALRRAISDANLDVAVAAKVGRYIQRLHLSIDDTGLDNETEDLLNSLGLGGNGASASPRQSTALEEVLADMSGEFEGLEDEVSSPGKSRPETPLPLRRRTSPGIPADEDDDTNIISEEDAAAEAEDDDEEECTAVEDPADLEAADPLEALIRASTPEPAKIDPFERARSQRHMTPSDYDVADDTPLPVPRPFHADGTHAVALVDVVGQQAADSSPFDDVEDLPLDQTKRSNTGRLLAVIAFVFAALLAVAYTKTDFFEAAKKDDAARTAAALAEIEKMQPKPGEITIYCETEDAAVWLLLGRTPMTSFVLPSSMIHELRIEHEGYRPTFMSVAGQHWSGEAEARVATLSASLVGEKDGTATVLPAFPPVADPPLAPGGNGHGPVKVDSTPSGAEVWMLVGSTPLMNLAGIEAGKDYAFKVLKDDHRPASVSFKAEDWYLSGTSGPIKPGLTKRLSLEPLPKASQEGAKDAQNGGTDKAVKGEGKRRKPKKKRRRRKKRR